tara:strand:+ start:112 stop:654 length:543 start_codon:yes stop_codon:yes gene_type:complete
MNINFDFLLFDYIVLLFTLIFVIFSFWKGFINSILGLLTWVGSVFITIFTYEFLSNYLNNIFLNIDFLSNYEQITYILSFLISIPLIFLLSLFLLKRIRKILSSDLDKQILGIILDKFFGIIYGLIFSYVIYSSVLYFTNNNEFMILKNFNIFLKNNSNILNQISTYNENIISRFIINNN